MRPRRGVGPHGDLHVVGRRGGPSGGPAGLPLRLPLAFPVRCWAGARRAGGDRRPVVEAAPREAESTVGRTVGPARGVSPPHPGGPWPAWPALLRPASISARSGLPQASSRPAADPAL